MPPCGSNYNMFFFPSQGKEIIEFYLKELEDEGIKHVPRWTPSSFSLPLPRPKSLSTSAPAPPSLTTTPAASVPQPAERTEATPQDTKHDGCCGGGGTGGGGIPADSLMELVAGTPEGWLLGCIGGHLVLGANI